MLPRQLLILSTRQLQEQSEPHAFDCAARPVNQVSKLEFTMPETPGLMRQKHDDAALTSSNLPCWRKRRLHTSPAEPKKH